jgi:signal transduction histidine kinase
MDSICGMEVLPVETERRVTRAHAMIIGGLAALGVALSSVAARRRRRAAGIAQRQIATLTEAINGLARAAQPEDFLVGVLRAIAEQLDAHWVMLFLHDQAADALAVHLVLKDGQLTPREQAAPNLVRPIPARDIPIWAELDRARRPIYVADVRTYPSLLQRDALIAQGVRSMLVVPLIVGETLIGWFSVRNTSWRTYRPDELDLAAALAQQAALAVQLTRLGAQGRQAAVLEERNRMAREIHDTLAQGFTGIVMQLEATESALETARPDLALDRLGRARELARASLAEARRSVWALRPQELEQQPFVAALRSAAVAGTAGTAIQLAVDVDGWLGHVPEDLQVDLLRVAQEAIANSVRHAAAHALKLRVHDDGHCLELRICDDGQGFVAPAARPDDGSGFGLTAMRERVERHGGQLIIRTAPGQGTDIIARVDRRPAQQRPHDGSEDQR